MRAHWKYLRYVLRHKWYVLVECFKYGLYWQGVVHDWHKFLPSEWFPYVGYFYGEDYPEYKTVSTYQKTHYGDKWTKEWAQERFNKAWLHHIHFAPHHWQHWVLREDDGETKVLFMPWKYQREMLADWRGAGRAINGRDDTSQWYTENKGRMMLHPSVRDWIEDELGVGERRVEAENSRGLIPQQS